MPARKTLSYGIIALAGVAAPFGMQVDDGRLRLSEGCSQATDCEPKVKWVCSHVGGDQMDYACIEGCGS